VLRAQAQAQAALDPLAQQAHGQAAVAAVALDNRYNELLTPSLRGTPSPSRSAQPARVV
jgi:hypothetical protein